MSAVIVSTAAVSTAKSAVTLRACLVDGERPSTSVSAIKGENGGIGFTIVLHFDESETARASGVAVGDNSRTINYSVRFEPLAQIGFRGAKRKVSNKYLLHYSSFWGRRSAQLSLRVHLRFGYRLIQCGQSFVLILGGRYPVQSRFVFELTFQLALRFCALLFLAGLFFLSFREGRSWSG